MTTPAPASRYADGVYDRNAPGQQDAGYAYVKSGYDSNEERLTSQALAAAQTPAEILRGIRPAFARAPLFPPRFGYPQDEIGIADVISVDRRYPDSSSEFSGTPGGYSASTGPSLGWW